MKKEQYDSPVVELIQFMPQQTITSNDPMDPFGSSDDVASRDPEFDFCLPL